MGKAEQKKQETHERLLEAARQAFVQEGYERASVNDIIALASSSKGAFYHHFDSKEAVFLELMDRRLDAQRDALQDAIGAGHVSNLTEYLTLAVDQGFNVYKNQDWAPLYMEFWAHATRSEPLRLRMVELYRKWRAYLAGVVRLAQQAGLVAAEIDPEKAAGMAIALFEGMELQLLIEEDVLGPHDVVALLARMLTPPPH